MVCAGLSRSLTVAGFILLLISAMPSWAGSWRGDTGATLELDYSDNLNLSSSDPQSDTLLSFSPYINFDLVGSSRASSSIRYQPVFVYSLGDARDNSISHELDADMDAILVRNRLGVRLRAQASQRVIDPNQGFGDSIINNPDNLSDTYSLEIAPYLLPMRLGNFAYLSLDFGLGLVVNQEGTDSGSGNLNVNLKNGPMFRRWRWELGYSRNANRNRDRDETDTLDSLNLLAGYYINRHWQVIGSLGYDELNAPTRRDVDGLSWALGGQWTPSPRTNLILAYGERFDGNTLLLDFTHRHRRIAWQGRYTRAIATANNEFLRQDSTLLTDAEGNPIIEAEDDQQFIPSSGPALDETLFIADSFDFSMAWALRRNSLSLRANYIKRDNLQLDLVTQDWLLSSRFGRRLSRRSSATLDLRWLQHNEDQDPLLDYHQWSLALAYNHTLGPRVVGALRYSYLQRDAENQDRDYSENRVTLSLSARF